MMLHRSAFQASNAYSSMRVSGSSWLQGEIKSTGITVEDNTWSSKVAMIILFGIYVTVIDLARNESNCALLLSTLKNCCQFRGIVPLATTWCLTPSPVLFVCLALNCLFYRHQTQRLLAQRVLGMVLCVYEADYQHNQKMSYPMTACSSAQLQYIQNYTLNCVVAITFGTGKQDNRSDLTPCLISPPRDNAGGYGWFSWRKNESRSPARDWIAIYSLENKALSFLAPVKLSLPAESFLM